MKKAVLVIIFILVLTGMASLLLAESHPDYNEAMNYFYRKDYNRAVELLKAYVEQRPEAQAYYRLGYALYELGKYSEAEEYFREAYVIDPEYSPEIAPQVRKSLKSQGISVQPSGAEPPITTDPSRSAAPAMHPVLSDKKKAFEVMRSEKPEGAVKSLEGLQPQQAPEAIAPQQPAALPAPTAKTTPPPIPGAEQLPPELQKAFEETMKQMPVKPGKGMPPTDMFEGLFPGMPKGVFAVLATLGIISQLVAIAVFIFYCLCYFLIGKKLNVRHSWMAWIPILQNYWPLIGTAGKSLKWGLLYLLVLPILGGIMGLLFAMISPFAAFVVLGIIGLVVFVVYINLWMLTTENLGKNRWLGLLMFVPIANLIWIAILAFSKTETETDAFDAARLA